MTNSVAPKISPVRQRQQRDELCRDSRL